MSDILTLADKLEQTTLEQKAAIDGLIIALQKYSLFLESQIKFWEGR